MDKFKKGNVELSAQASAVEVAKGIAAKTDFKDSVAIFTITKGSLFYETLVEVRIVIPEKIKEKCINYCHGWQ